MGNTFVHEAADAALAGAAADGNRDAFGLLFERHLPAVFEAAWHVLHDREVAAEIARDTFAAAWRHVDAVPPEAFAESLLDSARHKAGVWLEANPQAAAPATGDPPKVGPVLRARMVTALEVQGIPTKVKVQEHVDGLVDFGPPSLWSRLRTRTTGAKVGGIEGWRRPGITEMLGGIGRKMRAGVAGLLASTGGRRGAAAVAVVVLGASGVVALGGGTGSPDGDATIETAARRDDEPRRRSLDDDSADSVDEDAGSPSTTASTTTSTTPPETTTTVGGPADDDHPEPTTPRPVAAPPTTAAPADPPPPPTTTRPAPAATARPEILWFDGHFYADDRGTCPSGHERLSMWWGTTGGQWIWIHTEGAVWQDVSWGMPDGNTEVCTPLGTKWYFEIRNSAGEATRTLQRNDFTY